MNKLLVSASVALGATSLSFAQQTEKPNFLLFIADDCSHYDLGCYGSVDSKTPNIDHFATQGVRFTQAYQAVPMSSPTRHNLYTGVWPVRSGAYPNHTCANEGTLSVVHHLQPLGYKVALIGKSHIAPKSVFPFDLYVPPLKGGDLNFEAIQKYDKLCGGFVWEWCDHAVAHDQAENGKTKYYYGGDHGEAIHDGNFCMDGLVYPDRTPHTGLLEYKNVYRPVRVRSFDQERGTLTLHNYMDFDDIQDFVDICYEVTQDGLSVQKGKVVGASAAPHSDCTVGLDIDVPAAGRAYLKLSYQLKKELPLVSAGHVLGFDELLLENKDGRNQTAAKWTASDVEVSDIRVEEDDAWIVLNGDGFTYRLDKRTGLFSGLQYAGREYLNHPMELNIWRAPTDNDMYIRAEWEKAHYDEAYTRAYSEQILQNKFGVMIMCHAGVVAPTVQKLIDVEIMWKIDGAGRIAAGITAVKDEELPDLPRFGIRMFLDKKLSEAAYYGMGPQESYRDKHRAASHGLFRSSVQELHEDYIMPQENGSHYDCDYVELTNQRYGMAVAAEHTFSFNASYYTQEVLTQTKHNYELTEADSTVLCIDHAQNGIGSNSCGPVVSDEYRFSENEFRFDFTLVPFVRG